MTTLSPDLPPSENFRLNRWKLTLPSGMEISPAALNAGYQDRWFRSDPDNGGILFRCPNSAGTTPNSSYSRCELREMRMPDGPASAPGNNWTSAKGGTLAATLRVAKVSSTGDADKMGRVVVGQIHGPETEVIRLYYHRLPGEKGRIYAAYDDVDNEGSRSEDIMHVPINDWWSYRISLQGLLLTTEIQYRRKKEIAVKKIDSRYKGLPLYFKAGVYNQNNTGEKTDGVKATFVRLDVTHP